MIKPNERVLVSLAHLDPEVRKWIEDSLAQYQNDLIDANTDRISARVSGKCEVLRDFLNSAKGAHGALERIRS